MARLGTLRQSIDLLARLIANSSHFQEEVAKFSEVEAAEHIHTIMAGDARITDAGDLPRPWALIEISERNKSRNGGGSGNTFDGNGWLLLTLAGELADPMQPGESVIAFADWAYEVLDDLCELAGVDDNLNIAEAQQEEVPQLSGPFTGDVLPYVWLSWRIQWTRY